MKKIAQLLLVASCCSLSPQAHADDATQLIARLHDELCDLTFGQVTSDPQSLAMTLLNVSVDESLRSYTFENELWIGVVGQRAIERFLVFEARDTTYRLNDCMPFRAMGRTSIVHNG